MSKYVEIVEKVTADDGFLQHIDVHVTVRLKRCPHCGGDGKMRHLNTEEGEDLIYIECEKCGIHTEAFEEYGEAAEKWNARKTSLARKGRGALPCPFCGGKAEADFALPPEDSDIPEDESALVRCTKCGNRTKVYVNSIQAVKVWNKRV